MIISTSPRAPVSPSTPPRLQLPLLRTVQQLRAHVTAIGMYAAEVAKEADQIAEQLAANERVPPLTVGQSLKVRRLALGLRQQELAALASLSRSQVSGLESGRRSAVGAVTALSEALMRFEQLPAIERERLVVQWRS